MLKRKILEKGYEPVLTQIIKKVISAHLEYECVQPEVIQKFIDSLWEIHYAKLSDRKMISALSRWQTAINEGFAGLMEQKGSLHTMSGIICDDFVKYNAKDDYRVPVEEMFIGLKELWGKSIFRLRTARFRFKIDMKRKPALRTLTIPLPISFQSFGHIIAASDGWYDETPHFFEVKEKKTNYTFIVSQDPIEEDDIYFENNTKLTDFNLKQYDIRYVRGEELPKNVNVEFVGILEGFSMSRVGLIPCNNHMK